jgi:hypothetical protein
MGFQELPAMYLMSIFNTFLNQLHRLLVQSSTKQSAQTMGVFNCLKMKERVNLNLEEFDVF